MKRKDRKYNSILNRFRNYDSLVRLGVLQGSILGSLLFNVYVDYFFFSFPCIVSFSVQMTNSCVLQVRIYGVLKLKTYAIKSITTKSN